MTHTAERPTIDTPIAFADDPPARVDVVIIGGGVIGVFAALSLARAGKRVFLAEKGRVAAEQSSRNWGWIRQQGRDAAELPVMIDARRRWLEVDRETNGECGVRECGVYYVASSPAEAERQERWLSVARAHDLDTRALTRAEIEAAFPGAAPAAWMGGIVTPSDMRGEPWRAVPAVARLARRDGALIRENCAVRALDIAAGRVAGVVTEAGRVAADAVILAGGAWSSLFARTAGVEIPQLSVRATVAQTAPLPEFFSGAAVDEEFALRRRDDGGYTIAAERHGFFAGPDMLRRLRLFLPLMRKSWRTTDPHLSAPAGFPDAWRTPRRWSAEEESPFERMRVLEPAPRPADVAALADAFAARFPALGRPRILSAWAGMIDTMPDVVPVVDAVPALPGLVVATGMSGHGFGIGPGFGEVAARLATGAAPGYDLSRFRLSRFSDGSRLAVADAL